MNVQGDTCADKARDFIGKGHPGGERVELLRGTSLLGSHFAWQSSEVTVSVAGRGAPSRTQNSSCLTLRNELYEETHVLRKQEILLGKGIRVESSRVREPRRTALPRGSQSRVLW